MANEHINKVVFGVTTLIDLTNDTITPADVINNRTFHMADGSITTGTLTYDADTKDATAVAAEILSGKTAYKNGIKIIGEMPNIGKQNAVISTTNETITISQGYHDGSGTVTLNPTEKAKLISSNIKNGVEILGVLGTLTGTESISVTTVTVTPTVNSQVLTPTSYGEYDYFGQVNIEAIPYTEIINPANGLTVTIAGV